jgi:hypothetical protein
MLEGESKGYHTFLGVLPCTYKGYLAKEPYSNHLFSVQAQSLLRQQRYLPLKIFSYLANVSQRLLRSAWGAWPGVIGPYSGPNPLNCALGVPRVQMPCNPVTLCRDLRTYVRTQILLHCTRTNDFHLPLTLSTHTSHSSQILL